MRTRLPRAVKLRSAFIGQRSPRVAHVLLNLLCGAASSRSASVRRSHVSRLVKTHKLFTVHLSGFGL